MTLCVLSRARLFVFVVCCVPFKEHALCFHKQEDTSRLRGGGGSGGNQKAKTHTLAVEHIP